MNLDPLSISLSQINYLVKNLSKRNYKSSVQEITELVSANGQEADRYLLRCLLSEIDFNSDAIRTPNSKDFQHIQLLTQLCTVLLRKPALVSLLVYAVDKTVHNNNIKNPTNLLPTLSKILKLTPVQEVVFGLSLLHSSFQSISESALYFIKQKLPILIRNYSNEDTKHTKVQEGGLRDSTPEVLHFILAYLLFPKEKAFLGIDSETKELFLKGLRRDFPKDLAPVILAPLLYPVTNWNIRVDKINSRIKKMTTNMNNELYTIIREMGYTFCSSIEDGRAQMNSLGMRDLPPSVVARILILMVRTTSGVEDVPQPCNPFWNNPDPSNDKSGRENSSSQANKASNVEIFVQLLKEFNPNLSWIDIIGELDNPDLIIKDRKVLVLLFTALRLGLQLQGFPPEQFPIEIFYRHWKHSESQLSIIVQMLKNPDVISFMDYPFRAICEDGLKIPAEIANNKEIAVWRSLDLLELLMYIADRGLAAQIHEVLKFPLQNCPDILALALIQMNQSMTLFRQELLATLLPLFIAGHPNASAVLHNLWNPQTNETIIHSIVLHGITEWYMCDESDPSRLARILDIGHELKVVHTLLNAKSYPFAIDLACLASRREYLKLDKWITDKIREVGDPFVKALIKFAQRRCPYLFVVNFKEDLSKPQIAHETGLTILTCLQSCIGSLPPETNETILTVLANSNYFLNKPRQQSLLRGQRGLDAFNPTLFNSGSQIDPLGGLSGIANLNINVPQTSNAFNVPGNFGQLSASNSASHSRIINPTQNNNFALLPQLSGPMNAQMNHMSSSGVSNGMSTINNLPQMMPQQANALEKYKINETTGGFVMPPEYVGLSPDVEDEANTYFQRIFSHPPHSTMTPEEVIETLKKFHQSPIKRERDVFHCVIRSLFDEYKFFYQYPDKELFIIAQLFAGVLAQGLIPITSALYSHGLKLIVEALRKPTNSKMYSFGVSALDQLKSSLKDLPKFCEIVLKLPFYHDLPSPLAEYLEFGARSQEPSHKSSSLNHQPMLNSPFKSGMPSSGTPTSSPSAKLVGPASARPSIATATNIDTLLVATEKDEKMVMPPESFQEKVAFVFNNLSQLNIQTKSDEIKDIVREEHYCWLAQYMVMKRASIEFNFHILYSNFVDTIKLPEFDKLVLIETYRNIKVLLRCDKTTANFSDRTLLKNLGHWLGVITLAKNRPILMDDLDVRLLLVEAQKKGSQEMLYVVPFVAKLMDSCNKSKVFKPPNPWTMSVIYLLTEIHQEPGLKLNLKFEVEVLLKSLQLDMKNFQSTSYLKEGDLVKNLEKELIKCETPSPSPATTPVPSQPLTPSSQNTASSVILSSGNSSSSVTPSLVNNTPTNEELMLQMAAQMPMSAPTTPNTLAAPVTFTPEPKYNLTTFNISSVQACMALLTVNSQLPLFQTYPGLKQCIRIVFERSTQEWLSTLVERAVKTAVNTTEIIIKNDFALDPDESRIRAAAQYMVRNLTAGMAMTLCRESLVSSLLMNLKSSLLNVLMKNDIQSFSNLHKDWVEQAVSTCVNDNIELICAFVQKIAIEKSVVEIDRHLLSEYEKRKNARNEGRRYCDSGVLTYQAERMPEQVRLKVGGVSPQQMAVYEDFARNIPGFQTLTDREAAMIFPINKPLTYTASEETALFFDRLVTELEGHLQTLSMQGLFIGNSNQTGTIQALLECLMSIKRAGPRDTVTGITLLQKIMENIIEYVDQITNETEILVRYHDTYARLLKTCQESRGYGIVWSAKAVANVTSLMEKLKMSSTSSNNSSGSNSSISSSSEYSSGGTASTAYIHSGILQTRECDDPPGLTEKIEMLLREWINAYQSSPLTKDHSKPFSSLVHQLNVNGLLKTDDLMTRFFRQSVRIVIGVYYRALAANEMNTVARVKVFHTLDGYARLMSMLVKHSGDATNTTTKMNLLHKILGIIAGVLLQDCEEKGVEFYQLPYHRIFSMLFMELTFADHVLDPINFQILQAFAHVYHIMRPSKAPAFAYAWLELISHRLFINRVLAITPQQKGWSMYAQLIIDLFKFLAPFLRNAELAKPVSALYKGTLRVLLVLLHDFPEFLCDYHYGFCDVIPPNCIQLRNLILSAFPRSMRLPDPFTPNLKVDLLPEIVLAPRILPNYLALITPPSFKKDLDSYLKHRAPATFLTELKNNLHAEKEKESNYNIPLVNAVILHIGSQAITDIRSRNANPNMTTIANTAHMDVFQHLAADLDPEGRYVLFNAIVNQLRYPNSHTHYFSCTLLYLFAEASAEVIQEQITRILLERIIVNRPHPWGLLITFIELIKNPSYKFWDHDFVHCAPEIEKLFESVANSCMGRKAVPVVPVENEVSEA